MLHNLRVTEVPMGVNIIKWCFRAVVAVFKTAETVYFTTQLG